MKILRFLDDVFVVAGCACILVGISKINIPATWITGGVMLIGAGTLFALLSRKKGRKDDPK